MTRAFGGLEMGHEAVAEGGLARSGWSGNEDGVTHAAIE